VAGVVGTVVVGEGGVDSLLFGECPVWPPDVARWLRADPTPRAVPG
jgi:hypothetical protein